ncbi:MAG: hypothetical protein ACPGU1_09810 [Myxococcota bacterium]
MRGSSLALILLLSFTQAGCLEWLEVDEPIGEADLEEVVPSLPSFGADASFPGAPARATADGPLVPMTPGLRVPDGYWTRVRIDQADLLLPFTWAAVQPAGYSADGELRGTLLRLQGHRMGNTPKEAPQLRAVIRIATPPGTTSEDLVGLTFGQDALAESTASVRISEGTLWNVMLQRLAITSMEENLITGTLEGEVRAGKRAKRSRTFRAAFVALRVDEPVSGLGRVEP